MIRQVILTCHFLHIILIAAGDRLVRKMQYCLRFSSAQEVEYAGRIYAKRTKSYI